MKSDIMDMKYTILLLAGFLFCFTANGFAQNQTKTITGTVADAQTGDPLAGVNILVVGTSTGAATDANGHYSLQVESLQDTLRFSFIGYKTKTVSINGRTKIDVTLKPQVFSGQQLVVVGYGTKKKENLTGAVSTVSSQEIESRPVTDVTNALQGTMSGVTVVHRSGQPGATQSMIRIRGVGTLNNSNPMVIVDGVPSSLTDVNPDDIASISVLKDAASASIYGSRAANGVILIKTKTGKAGTLHIHYRGYVGKQEPTRLPDFVPSWQAAKLNNELNRNEDRPVKFTNEDINKFKSGKYPDEYPNTDWLSLLYNSGSGIQQKHYVDVSGGTQKTQYMFSLSYLNQNGIVRNTDNKQYSARINLTSNVIKNRLTVHAKLTYKRGLFEEPTEPYVGAFSQIMRQVNRISRMIPYKYSNGIYGTNSDGNPIAWLNEGGMHNINSHFIRGSAQGDLKIFKGLHVKPMLAYRSTINRRSSFIKDFQFHDKAGDPTLYQGPTSLTNQNDFNSVVTLQTLLEYKKSVHGSHNIHALFGYSQEYTNYNWLQGFRKNFLNHELSQLNAGPPSGQTNSGASHEQALRSFFGRLNYNYKQKYLVEGNLRYDGSSRFSAGNRWGLFPSFSAGWNISKESFFKPLRSWISNLKITGSWGELGNQRIEIDNQEIYYPYISTISSGLNYNFGGSIVSGLAPTAGANANITWETTTQKNIGLDAGFLQGKMTLNVDYFIKNTTGILLRLPVAAAYGLTAPVENAGGVRNKGWEFTVGYRGSTHNFSYKISGNTSFIKNEITDLHGLGPIISGFTFMQEGYPINSYYGYIAEGIFQTQKQVDEHAKESGGPIAPGDLMYKDLNDDGTINGEDRTYLGSSIPKITYGLNIGLNWKGVDLKLFLQGAADVKGFVQSEILGQAYATDGKPTSVLLDAWTPENHSTKFPRLWKTYTQNDPATNPSSFWIRDASYMRLKNLEVGYTFPQKWTQKVGLEKAKIYYSGQNILTISPFYSWVDPEAPPGERGYTYPQVMVNTFGISLTF